MGKRKGRKPVGSLCWSCENAHPKGCAWVNEFEPVWAKARAKKVRTGTVYVVQQCKHYMGGAKDDYMPGVRSKASA